MYESTPCGAVTRWRVGVARIADPLRAHVGTDSRLWGYTTVRRQCLSKPPFYCASVPSNATFARSLSRNNAPGQGQTVAGYGVCHYHLVRCAEVWLAAQRLRLSLVTLRTR